MSFAMTSVVRTGYRQELPAHVKQRCLLTLFRPPASPGEGATRRPDAAQEAGGRSAQGASGRERS